jgi:shikimate kinase
MQMDLTRNSKIRPLLITGVDRREVLEQLMQEREPMYRQEADVVYETDGRSPQTAAREIAGEVRKLWQF